jgi:glucokinase
MPKAKENLIIGVDIGGTKVAAGLVNSSGDVLMKVRTGMNARGSAAEGLQSVFDAIDGVFRDRRARRAPAIGVSAAGWVDSRRGVLLSAANIPCWRDFPLIAEIKKRYGLPARLGNDANVAALAEAAWGAGAKYDSVFYVTLGTGIGSGFVLRKEIIAGRTGAAGEGGHMSIDFRGPQCGCGKRGCIELYASGTGIARRACERLAHGASRRSKVLALANGKRGAVTSEIVFKAALGGDALAIFVVDEAVEYLAMWLGNIIDLLEPEAIVFGGGMGQRILSYQAAIRRGLEIWAINPRRASVAMVAARFGAESALVGAAAQCLSRAKIWNSRSPHRSIAKVARWRQR